MDIVQVYIDNSGKWVYMFNIIDIFTREIVSHHEDLRCFTKEALKVLDEAVDNRNNDDLVIRTYNFVQFRSRDFQSKIRELDISYERIIVNTPEENFYIERFHSTLKDLKYIKTLL